MKKYSFILLLLAVILSGCGTEDTSSGSDTSNDTTKLKVVSFLPMDHQFTKDIVPMWLEKVAEETNGAIELEWIGGPESIPTEEQFDAVTNGLVDIGFNVSSYYGHIMPESHSLHLSPFQPWEERENGYYDYMNGLYDQYNMVYLGRWLGPNPFYFWTNKEIGSLSDLEGLKIRSNPTYHDILTAIKANPVEVVPGDVYTSLERNMVDGFGFPLLGPNDSGWTEVTKFIIDEPFLNQNGTILINKDVYSSLSTDLQETLVNLTAEFEKEMVDYFNKVNEEEWKAIEEAGLQKIELSEEDSEKFQNIVKEVKWEAMKETAPDHYEELRNLLDK
ncbi:TRAP transporter substrate-binding protein DctP [Siminovitchia sediminis]|uniref:TRAP transporter substrate-binding protein DctP n=1 Tax=Siminovitchia sediminis TaxID=1274353 RepID=A0ABW4KNI9_9BACI